MCKVRQGNQGERKAPVLLRFVQSGGIQTAKRQGDNVTIESILISGIVALAVLLLLVEQYEQYRRAQIMRRTRRYTRRGR